MLKKLRSKRFWKAFAINFLVLFVLRLILNPVFVEEGEKPFGAEAFSDTISWALMLGFIFAIFHKPVAEEELTPEEKLKELKSRKAGFYLQLFMVISLFILVVGFVLLGIAWLIFYFFLAETADFMDFFVKGLLSLVILCLLVCAGSFLLDKWRIKRLEKSNP